LKGRVWAWSSCSFFSSSKQEKNNKKPAWWLFLCSQHVGSINKQTMLFLLVARVIWQKGRENERLFCLLFFPFLRRRTRLSFFWDSLTEIQKKTKTIGIFFEAFQSKLRTSRGK
jgi:hypothetical protein